MIGFFSNKKFRDPKIIILLLVAVAFAFGYALGGEARRDDPPPDSRQRDNGKVQMWTCAMHPQIKQSRPGRCPICGMELVPIATNMERVKHEGSEVKGVAGMSQITLSRRAMKLAEVEVSPVERKDVSVEIRLFGRIEYDETRIGHITAWVPGRIDHLFVDYTGRFVRKGEPMIYLYSPELLTAQAELIQALKTMKGVSTSEVSSIKKTARQTIFATREKLRLLGLTESQIKGIEKTERPTDHVIIYSPMSGVIIHKNAIEGMYVNTGTKIYTIADISNVWAKLDIYESDIPWIEQGQEVQLQVDAYPGKIFEGSVSFIDPFVDPKTRTIKVRVNVPNPDGKLKPDMFVRAMVHAPVSKLQGEIPLLIPASAPLITGKRAVVYVKVPGKEGTFQGREIVLGPKAGDYYVVLKGLKVGEYVVTNGAFKIDSDIQIQAKPSMMNPKAGMKMEGHHH
nr:efflux RND transporter periplasmic adaptor subunit [Desulfobacterales bacterium]